MVPRILLGHRAPDYRNFINCIAGKNHKRTTVWFHLSLQQKNDIAHLGFVY